jgi:hypothetical protein
MATDSMPGEHSFDVPMSDTNIRALLTVLAKIPGGYTYEGVCSSQYCFPLKNGGELRFALYDDMPDNTLGVDLYDGFLPPGITGFAQRTG